MKLQDKVRPLTAGAGGIGKAAAVRFARQGGQVAVADSVACAATPIYRQPGVRHFMRGVLIGSAVLAAVFMLV